MVQDDGVPSKQLIIMRIQLNIIFINISIQLISSKDLSNLDELIVIVVSMEKRLLAENLHRESGESQAKTVYKPSRQTCIHNSTYPDYSHTLGSQPRARGL
jgi:hypothetical protein